MHAYISLTTIAYHYSLIHDFLIKNGQAKKADK